MPRRFSREPRSAWGRGRSRSRTRAVRRVQSAGGPMRPARGWYRLTPPSRRLRDRRGCAPETRASKIGAMRQATTLIVLLLAAGCWLAAGPGGLTVRALLACRHHHAAAGHAGHHGPLSVPSDAPCFCADMTGASDLATVSPAVPVPELLPVLTAPVIAFTDPSPVPRPPSPSFAPESPPPDPCA